MSYVGWAMVAMVGYGTTAVLLKVVLRTVPPEVALVVTNTMLVAAAVALVILRRQSIPANLNLDAPTLLLFAAGVTLSLSISSFYLALSRGPASVVVPIFAMNFAVASVLGMIFLEEGIKATRVLGVILAAGAIVLLTR